jgi:hypothetical protein
VGKKHFRHLLATSLGVGLAATVPAMAPATADAYRIESNSAHKCLDLRYDRVYLGARVWLWQCNNTPAQNWVLVRTAAFRGGYQIRLWPGRPGGWCLDAPEQYGRRPGASVQLWRCDPRSPSEVWYVPVMYTDQTMPFLNRFNGLALDVYGSRNFNGARIVTWGWNRGYNQDWWVLIDV